MFESTNVIAIVFVLLGTLAVAHVAVAVLSNRQGMWPDALQRDLRARLRGWWIIVAAVGGALLFGRMGLVVLFALVSALALREFLRITDLTRHDHGALLVSFLVVIPVQYLLIAIEWYGLYSIALPVYAFIILPVVSVLRGEPERFLVRATEALWAVLLTIYCLSYVPALATLDLPGGEQSGLLLVVFLLVVTQMSDVLQYVWGKALGRTRIAPAVSPGKTAEGALLGIVSAAFLGMAFHRLIPFTPVVAFMLAAVVAGLGFAGGLVLSAIKRDRQTKDWGWQLPGHGGVLDRVDSLVFSAPVFFHLVRYAWTH